MSNLPHTRDIAELREKKIRDDRELMERKQRDEYIRSQAEPFLGADLDCSRKIFVALAKGETDVTCDTRISDSFVKELELKKYKYCYVVETNPSGDSQDFSESYVRIMW